MTDIYRAMNDQHPITPPPDLVEQWEAETAHTTKDEIWHVAVQATQWGADQELEACIELLKADGYKALVRDLRTARRPKPPSLKEQAYDALDTYIYGEPDPKDKERTYNTILRALEALPND
jgi:hypothetical protein